MVQGMYDSFELITTDPPSYSVLLSSSPDQAAQLKVIITYTTSDYPESATCEVSIENAGKHNRLQVGNLNKEVASLCAENIGMYCVVLILQHVQQFLVQSAAEAQKVALQRRGDEMTRIATQATAAITYGNVIASDPTIHIGTAVTRQLFEE